MRLTVTVTLKLNLLCLSELGSYATLQKLVLAASYSKDNPFCLAVVIASSDKSGGFFCKIISFKTQFSSENNLSGLVNTAASLVFQFRSGQILQSLCCGFHQLEVTPQVILQGVLRRFFPLDSLCQDSLIFLNPTSIIISVFQDMLS